MGYVAAAHAACCTLHIVRCILNIGTHFALASADSDVERLKAEVLSLKKQLVDAAAAQTAMQSRATRAEAEVVLLERQYVELLSAKAEVVPLDANGVKYEQRLHDFKVIGLLQQPCTLLCAAACCPLCACCLFRGAS